LIYRWGIHERIDPLSGHCDHFKIFRNDGKYLASQPMSAPKGPDVPEAYRNSPGYDMHRGDLHQIFLDTAREYGADVRLGSPVTTYFETETHAGVEVHGKEYTADVVIGADGFYVVEIG
jgi:flavin-dependent dehydrogenase